MPHSECRLRRETLKSKVRTENEENSERTLQREDRKACFGQFHADGIRSFPHDERGKRCAKSVTIHQGKGL